MARFQTVIVLLFLLAAVLLIPWMVRKSAGAQAVPIAANMDQVGEKSVRVYGRYKNKMDPETKKWKRMNPAATGDTGADKTRPDVWAPVAIKKNGGVSDWLTFDMPGGPVVFEPVSWVVNGQAKQITPAAVVTVSPTLDRAGLWYVQYEDDGARILVRSPAPCSSFSKGLRIKAPGREVSRVGPVWVFTKDGDFDFMMDPPEVLMADMTPYTTAFMDHTVTAAGEDFLYSKVSTAGFDSLDLPANSYIAASIVTTGVVGAAHLRGTPNTYTYAEVREMPGAGYIYAGYGYDTTMVSRSGTTTWDWRRAFWNFPMTALDPAETIESVVLKTTMMSSTGGTNRVSIQEGTQGASLTISDFDEFTPQWTGGSFGTIEGIVDTEVATTMNATGVAYFQSKLGDTAYVALRDFDHDYTESEPTVGTTKFVNTYNVRTPAKEPYLEITFVTAPSGSTRFPHGVSSWAGGRASPWGGN